MKIRKLQLKNIGVFDDETIEFKECEFNKDKNIKDRKAEIHILTGENGTGKTTILQALARLFRDETIKGVSKTKKEQSDKLSSLGTKISLTEVTETVINVYNHYVNHPSDIKEPSFSVDSFHKYFKSAESCFLLDLEDEKLKASGIKISKDETSIINLFKAAYKDEDSKIIEKIKSVSDSKEYSFAAFAYSGYRRIRNEKINLFDEIDESPLQQALDFVKNENSRFTVNQWLGRNLSKRALALQEDDKNEAKMFETNVKNLEKIISEIVGYDIYFKLKTDLSLVLLKDGKDLDFDVLPDGLKSLISWIGDLLMRLDSLEWENDTPIFERELILFLDEIEVHLHPAWQRKVLPIVQKLFKNAQIFVSTHSPFVVNSVDDAWVYKLKLDENGKARCESVVKSEDGYSYETVLREIFDIDQEFGGKTQEDLDEFYKIIRNGKTINDKELLDLAKALAIQSEELNSIVQIELRQLNRKRGTNYSV